MSALYKSIDEQLAELRAQHESEMQACKDRTLAAEVEAALLKEQLAKAVEERAFAERITTKLLTQFSAVEAVFAEAKRLAISVAEQPAEGGTILPKNEYEGESA